MCFCSLASKKVYFSLCTFLQNVQNIYRFTPFKCTQWPELGWVKAGRWKLNPGLSNGP